MTTGDALKTSKFSKPHLPASKISKSLFGASKISKSREGALKSMPKAKSYAKLYKIRAHSTKSLHIHLLYPLRESREPESFSS